MCSALLPGENRVLYLVRYRGIHGGKTAPLAGEGYSVVCKLVAALSHGGFVNARDSSSLPGA